MADDNNDIKNIDGDKSDLETSEDTNSPQEELKEIGPEEKIKELEDTLFRTVAEMDNVRRDLRKKV